MKPADSSTSRLPSSRFHSTSRPLLASLTAASIDLPAAYPTVAFQYRPGPLTAAELAQYHRDGFIVKRQFYSADEMRYLLSIAKSDRELDSNAIDVPDAGGRKSKLTVWNYLSEGVPDDIYSAIGRGERMVGVMEQLLGDEVYEAATSHTTGRSEQATGRPHTDRVHCCGCAVSVVSSYHYHSKMMLKEPKVGGAWEWHQVRAAHTSCTHSFGQ